MKFCTAITCMDGRIQLPVIKYLQKRLNTKYVDLITEPGPNLILAKQTDIYLVESVIAKLKISVEKHNSIGAVVVGHHDCAGNIASKEEQLQQIHESVKFIRQSFNHLEVFGLWVDENWKVQEI
ncbi:carbonic anhydrase [Bacteroidota bacterium]